MKTTEFKKGQSVVVTTKKGKVEGTISCVDMNVCTFEVEYSVDYLKEGQNMDYDLCACKSDRISISLISRAKALRNIEEYETVLFRA